MILRRSTAETRADRLNTAAPPDREYEVVHGWFLWRVVVWHLPARCP